MKSIGYLLGALALAFVIYLAVRSQRVLEAGLPPRFEHATQAEALAACGDTTYSAILGTGSMAPFIPAAPAGVDPRSVTVAYAIERPGARYEDITPGAFVIYRPKWNKSGRTAHQAALQTPAGWVMSGLHNERSEAWEPITAAEFVGIIAAVHTWKQ